MHTFKVGDKIRCITPGVYSITSTLLKHPLVVTRIYGDVIVVQCDIRDYPYPTQYTVEPEHFAKSSVLSKKASIV